VWDLSVAYHLEARAAGTVTGNLSGLWDQLLRRDGAALLAAVLAAIGLALFDRVPRGQRPAPDRSARMRITVVVAAVWTATAVLLVVLHRPLFTQHATALIVPLCVLIGLARPWWPALCAALALQVPGQLHDVSWRAGVVRAHAPTSTYIIDLQALVPAGTMVLADDPGVLWWSGRPTPPELIDTSFVRIETQRLSAADVEAAAADPRTCAVLAVSGRFVLFSPLDLPGYEVARIYGPGQQLWIRTSCADARDG
jgi:hypothetical protein